MGDLTVLAVLGTAICVVLAVGAALPGRLLDWIDLHVLAPRKGRR